MHIYIIYRRFINEITGESIIGGLQTYIENLTDYMLKLGYDTTILQFSTKAFECSLENGLKIIGVTSNKKNWTKTLIDKACELGNIEDDLLIFATSTQVMRHKFKKSISIQHGIYWDIPTIHDKQIIYPLDTCLRMFQTMQEIKRQKLVSKIICVDYNYINWYRTQTTNRKLNYAVIPNFSKLLQIKRKENSEKVRIVFARRFETIRGVDILKDIFPDILHKYPNVELTIAGGGSREKELHEEFDEFSQVTFTQYKPSESIEFHKKFDIAVVPTIGSEGTSFSLLEAMADKCAVICSDVGGMSNIILDKFNGRIVRPMSQDFREAIEELIENRDLRNRYGNNAYKTVKDSFSQSKWEESWKKIIMEFE